MTMSDLESVLVAIEKKSESDSYVEWYRFAFLAATLANINRGKRGKRVKPEDFIGKPPWERQKKGPRIITPQEIAAAAQDAQAKGLKVPGM